MYPAISTEGLLNIPITLPKESTRQKITEKVKESRKSREQSKQLLEIAKTGVERAILWQRGDANETDEAAATAWINWVYWYPESGALMAKLPNPTGAELIAAL